VSLQVVGARPASSYQNRADQAQHRRRRRDDPDDVRPALDLFVEALQGVVFQLAQLVNGGNGLSSQFLFHHKTLDAFMPERILHWLRRRYEHAKGTRPTPRAVVFGLATYLSEFSTVSQGEHLIPTIQLMFRKDGVSTLFVDTHSHLQNGLDLREFFDIVMKTNRQRERGEVRLAVERSIIGKASRRSRLLHRTQDGLLTLVDDPASSKEAL
jgi:hypothetical protein